MRSGMKTNVRRYEFEFVYSDWIIIGRIIVFEQARKKNSGAKFDAVNKYSIQIWILISFICSYVSFITCVLMPHASRTKAKRWKKSNTRNLWPSIYCSFVSFASTTIELNKEINNFFRSFLSRSSPFGVWDALIKLLWGRCFMWQYLMRASILLKTILENQCLKRTMKPKYNNTRKWFAEKKELGPTWDAESASRHRGKRSDND